MPILTRLTDEEARAVAETVLKDQLSKEGFDHAEVRSGEDHDGEAALFVTAVMQAGRDIIPGDTFSRAYEALDDRLRAKGEQRFPYFDLKWIGDEPLDDASDDPA